MDPITKATDERLAGIAERDSAWTKVNEGFPPADRRLLLHSLRAAIAERDLRTLELNAALAKIVEMTKERDAALLRAESAEAIVARIEAEGMAKHIGLEGPLYHSWGEECPADDIADALVAYLRGEK